MKVWIVNPFDTLPAEGARPLRFWLMAEAFAKAGHDVVFWTADFNHVTKRRREFLSAPSLPVRLVHAPPYSSNVSFRRLWSHWRWAKAWAAAAKEEPSRPDLVVASSPPLSSACEAVRFARGCGARVVVDLMDAWPDTFKRVLPRPLHFLLAPLERLSRRTLREADAVTAVSRRFLDIAEECGGGKPARLFYHGIALGPAARKTGGGGLRVVYAGNLGVTYDLATAMEAVAMVDGATLSIAGAGTNGESLRKLAREPRFAGKISFAGLLDGAELRDFLEKADIGVIPMRPESCVGVPYKLADYAAASLAVVSSLGGESAKLLAEYGAGVEYRPGDPASLAAALRRLAPVLPEAKRASRRLAEERFDAARIYSAYVDFATSV